MNKSYIEVSLQIETPRYQEQATEKASKSNNYHKKVHSLTGQKISK